ncbi:MAG: hypothetical protein AAGH79_04140 [Bacteroidota bacterium]
MSDSRNPNDPQWADAGWLQMQEILDREMPVERRRRLGIWWWAAAGVLLLLLSAWWLHGSAWNTDFGPANTIAEGPAADLPKQLEARVLRLSEAIDQYQAGKASQKTKSTYLQPSTTTSFIASTTHADRSNTVSFASSDATHSEIPILEELAPEAADPVAIRNPFGPAINPVGTLPTQELAFATGGAEKIDTPQPSDSRWSWTGSVLGFLGTHQQSGLGMQSMVNRNLGKAQKWQLGIGLSYRQNLTRAFLDEVSLALESADEESAPIVNQDSMPAFNNSGSVDDLNAPRYREFSLPISVGYRIHPRWRFGIAVRPAMARITYPASFVPLGQGFTFDSPTRFDLNPVNPYGEVQQTVLDLWYGAGVQFKLAQRWNLDLQWQRSTRSWQLPQESKVRQMVQLGVAYQIR